MSIRLKVICVWTMYIFILTACSSTRMITPKEDFKLDRKAGLVLDDNAIIGIMSLYTKGDSITARDYSFNREYLFHFSEVQKIEVKDHTRGAWQGFLWLGAIGAAYGTFASFNTDERGPLRWTAPFIWGMFGGAGGTLIGAVKAKTETYYFKEIDGTGRKPDDQ